MGELAKMYQPAEVEPKIHQKWKETGAFHAEPARADGVPTARATGVPYCIVIPPPNVTAALHMGHALNNTLQDILVRWRRMAGDNAVWIPGTDHAGIATQTVVEKRVLAEQGKRRTDFQREEFVKLIQAWKDEYEATITNQLKMMGCSCDWDRQRFTMDEICAQAVREAFFQLFKDGLIFRGKRLVNWDPATRTALADDEVEMEEIDGHFYYLRYPLVEPVNDGQGGILRQIVVATTRPETMLGDTAVAINPRDPRAKLLHGKKVLLPIVNRQIPIIEDDYVVLPDPDSDDAKARYATGLLKVTPAHDENDYLIGQRHGLPIINVFAPDATISKNHGWPGDEWTPGSNNTAGDLLGMDRFEAREAIVDWFRRNGLLEEVRPYRHAVGHSYRSHVPIEPYLSDQWYVDVDKEFSGRHPAADGRGGTVPGTKIPNNSLAGLALRAMKIDQRSADFGVLTQDGPGDTAKAWEGKLRMIPDRYAKPFQTWHENIRDWCISRQLWWGHQIPVWSKPGSVSPFADGKVPEVACVQQSGQMTYVCLKQDDVKIVSALEAQGFVRDSDVLDTWFSSALWPMSTLGWPQMTDALRTWNPSNTLCTAREILTLWVSRMVMFNLYLRGCLPFVDVFVHAMIQDGQGRKMSKSLGNGVDPLDIIHSHGSDAMRFTLAQMTTLTQDVRMPVERDTATNRNTSPKFDLGRNFSNKIWNATRFAMSHLGAEPSQDARGACGQTSAETASSQAAGDGIRVPQGELSLADRWILSRLTQWICDSDAALTNFEFANYAQGIYDFFWRDLCDWYIEAVKPTIAGNAKQKAVLAACLDAALRLMHPVMPFISETLWEHLNSLMPARSDEIEKVLGVHLPASELAIAAAWPSAKEFSKWLSPVVQGEFELIQQVVVAIRQVRTTYKIPPRQQVVVSAKIPAKIANQLSHDSVLIETLSNTQVGEFGPGVEKPADAAAITVGEIELYLHGLIQADAEKERLAKRLAELAKSIATLQGRLSNKSYTDKAPAHLVQQTQDQLSAAQKEHAGIEEQLKKL